MKFGTAKSLNAEPVSVMELLKSLSLHEHRALTILINAMKFKDPYTFYHVRRVACYSAVVCAELRLHPQISKQVLLAALAHDVGKIGTPDRVLKKPGRLTKDEFLIMKEHPAQSIEMIIPFKELNEVIPIIRHHHERLDGYGYPDGLKGDQIPFGARVILVADTYDAMVSDRPYRRGCAPTVAFEELRQCSGSQFDPEVVDAFIRGMERTSQSEFHQIEKFIDSVTKPE